MKRVTLDTRGGDRASGKLIIFMVVVILLSVSFSAVFSNSDESSGFNPDLTYTDGAGFSDIQPRGSDSDETEINTIEDLQRMNSDLTLKYIQTRNLDFNDSNSYADMNAYLAALGWEISVRVTNIVLNGSYYDVTFAISYKAGNMTSFDPMISAQVQYMFGKSNTGVTNRGLTNGSITVLGSISEFDGVTPLAFMIGGVSTDANVPALESKFAFSMFVSSVGDEKTSYHMGNFTSIGAGSTVIADRFSGSYNGNGYSITGMEVAFFIGTDPPSDRPANSRGMFGLLHTSAVIDNVKLIDGSITGSMILNCNSSSTGGIGSSTSIASFGGVAGYAYAGAKITNCFNNGTVVASTGAGGIVGYTTGASEVSYCTNYGNVTAQGCSAGGVVGSGSNVSYSVNYGNTMAYLYTGGVIAYSAGSGVTVTNCVNYGDVYGYADQFVAGVVGDGATISITDCVNFGNIRGVLNTGGVVGRANTSSALSNLVNHGTVTGNNTTGGVVGHVASATLLTNLVNHGTVTGNIYTGGVIGQTATVTVLSNSVNYGNVTGTTTNTGGVAGFVSNSASGISDSVNYGNVTGTGHSVGGIAGRSAAADIMRVFNYGNVTGHAPGDAQVGGILGILISTTATGKIEDAHNGGNVTSAGSKVGGIVGYLLAGASEINNSSNHGSVNGLSEIGGIVGLASNGKISYSNNTGEVKGTKDSIGGIAGVSRASLTYTINTGDVKGTGGTSTVNVGGIAGRLESSSVTVSANYGNVHGNNRVGGIVGQMVLVNGVTGNGLIENCYNIGSITAVSMTNTGGIVGNIGFDGSSVGNNIIRSVYNISTSQLGGIVGSTANSTRTTISEAYYPNTVSGGYTAGTTLLANSGFTVKTSFPSVWFGGSSVWAIDETSFIPSAIKVNYGMPYFAEFVGVATATVDHVQQIMFHGEFADTIAVSLTGTGLDFVRYNWQISEFDGMDWSAWSNITNFSNLPLFRHGEVDATDPFVRYQCIVSALVPNGAYAITGTSEVRGYFGLELTNDLPIVGGGKLEYSVNGTNWEDYTGEIMLVDLPSLNRITTFHVRGPHVAATQGTIGWTDGINSSTGRIWNYTETITDNLVLDAKLGHMINVSVSPVVSAGDIEYDIDNSGTFVSMTGEILFGKDTASIDLKAIDMDGVFDEWTGDLSAGIVSGNTINLTSVSGPLSFVAKFIMTYTITLTDVGLGTTTSDVASVDYGGSFVLTFTPINGWKVDTVTINNGTPIPVSGTSYTISSVDQDQVVDVEYIVDTSVFFTITLTDVGSGTTISDVASVNYGGSFVLAFAPINGWKVDTVTINNGAPIPVSGTSYTISSVDQDLVVDVEYMIDTSVFFTITLTDVGSGTTISDVASVNYGGSFVLTFTPINGWKVDTVTINNGAPIPVSGTSYTISSVNQDQIVDVEYIIDTSVFFTITLTDYGQGTTTSDVASVNYGGSFVLTFAPVYGWKVYTAAINNGTPIPVSGTSYTISSVDQDNVVDVVYIVDTSVFFTITLTDAGMGTTTSDVASVNYGDRVYLTFAPINGWKVDTVTINNGTPIPVSGTSYTMSPVDQDQVVEVEYIIDTSIFFTIILTDVGMGTTTSDVASVNYGDNFVLTFAPINGWKVNAVTINNGVPIPVSGTSYTISSVDQDQIVDVEYIIDTSVLFTIILTDVGMGATTSDVISVNYGDSFVLTFAPINGWKVNAVTINNGVPIPVSGTSYTILSVDQDLVVDVEYVIDTSVFFTIILTDVGMGATTSDVISVNYGDNFVLTFAPINGWKVSTVTINNGTPIPVSGTSYTILSVDQDQNVEVGYIIDTTRTYTIIATTGTGGTLDPIGTVKVSYGSNQTFSFMPASGYKVSMVKVNGIERPDLTSEEAYTFVDVRTNQTLEVYFMPDMISFEIEVEGNGLVEYSIDGVTFLTYGGTIFIEIGTDIKLRAFPGDDYHFATWESGSSRYTSSEIEFNNIRTSMSIVADFKENDEGSFNWWILLTIAVIIGLLIVVVGYRRSLTREA